ncbi:DUF6641 family protein [Limnohabitans sp.]|uniref:DUF6641 family protein n=1 Tax=Limnohabitans sp. TaxID=1907725 RepID=UPI0039BD820F|nr:hypothetical protein [Comamonadaceae bacterium]
MATLSTLKLSTVVKPTHMPAVQVRRNKLVKRLWEQIELAKAQEAGTQFAPIKLRSYVDKETGFRRQVESTKRVKPWWFTADNGKLAMNVRYGARVIELAKGKSSIEIGSTDQLVHTLELIKQAVEAGELDAQIEAAAIKLREGFGK